MFALYTRSNILLFFQFNKPVNYSSVNCDYLEKQADLFQKVPAVLLTGDPDQGRLGKCSALSATA